MTVDELIALLDKDDARGEDAAGALAEYLEQGPPPAATVAQSPLAMELNTVDAHSYYLTGLGPAEPDEPWDEVVTGLVTYVQTHEHPRATAVWALGKAHDPRAAEALARVLLKYLDKPEEEHLAFQALIGLKALPAPPRDVIAQAAERGSGQVAANAQRYLALVSA